MTRDFEEKYDHEAGFAAHYNERVVPVLDEAEQKRKQSIKKIKMILGAGVVLALISLYFFFPYAANLTEDQRDTRLMVLGAIALAAGGGAWYFYSDFRSHMKETVTPLVCEFFDGISYQPKNYLGESETKPFGILPTFDRYKGEDLISMKQGDLGFTCCELKLTETRGSGKNSRTVTTFKGVALKIDLPRAVTSPITVKPDKFIKLDFFSRSIDGVAMERVHLEDPVFERLFDVYSGDQIESRRVLQPALMVSLIQFGMLMENWGKDLDKFPEGTRPGEMPSPEDVENARFKFSLGFRKDELLMLVPCNHDMFETGSIFKSVYDTSEVRCFLYQIHLINQIVKELEKFPQLT